ncbi:MAG: hypothetical protein ACE5F5_11510 [Acidimicrobiia bacterium]
MEQPTLDQVRAELAEIHEELLRLPPEDYARRSQLRERQQELRQLSHKLIEGMPLHDKEMLRAAFQRLSEVRDRLLEQHLSYASTSVGDAGIESEFTAAINKAMDAGLGVDEIEARLEEILEQLKSSG